MSVTRKDLWNFTVLVNESRKPASLISVVISKCQT